MRLFECDGSTQIALQGYWWDGTKLAGAFMEKVDKGTVRASQPMQ